MKNLWPASPWRSASPNEKQKLYVVTAVNCNSSACLSMYLMVSHLLIVAVV